jgi:hypothetical protein
LQLIRNHVSFAPDRDSKGEFTVLQPRK